MQIPTRLYTFVGCTTALSYFAGKSAAPDQEIALSAAAELHGVAAALLDGVAAKLTEEQFKDLLDTQVVQVLTSIETLRGTSLHDGLDSSLTSLLEHFYNAADALMGGGGGPSEPLADGVGGPSISE